MARYVPCRHAGRVAASMALLGGFGVAAGVVLARKSPLWLGIPVGQLASPLQSALGGVMAVVPVALPVGTLLPCLVDWASPKGGGDGRVGALYAAEALGSMVLGAALSLLLLGIL